MATSPIYAGGGRRAAAPQFTPVLPTPMSAQDSDALLNTLVQAMQQYTATQTPQTAPQFNASASGDSFGGGGAGGQDSFGGSISSPGLGGVQDLSQAVNTIGVLGGMLSNIGYLSKDVDLFEAGNTIGKTASVANAIANPSVQTLAPIALSQLNVPAPIGNMVVTASRGGTTLPDMLAAAATGLIATNPFGALLATLFPVQSTIKGKLTPTSDATPMSVADTMNALDASDPAFQALSEAIASNPAATEAANTGMVTTPSGTISNSLTTGAQDASLGGISTGVGVGSAAEAASSGMTTVGDVTVSNDATIAAQDAATFGGDAGGGGGGGGGGCFLTTAAVTHFNLPDDCYELTVLRGFRDAYMKASKSGSTAVAWYYLNAPLIVEAIDAHPDKAKIYDYMWYNYIIPAVEAIENRNEEDAAEIYAEGIRYAAAASGAQIGQFPDSF
jgi:hypothetical protein